MRIGIIGLGAIGSFLAEKIGAEKGMEIAFVFDTDAGRVAEFDRGLVLDSIENFKEKNADLVVECASHSAVKEYAEKILRETDLVVMSSSAFADKELYAGVRKICSQSGNKLYIPSGAVIGIDGIRAVQGELEKVELTTVKSPAGFGRTDTERKVIFEGNAGDACKQFPRNINIAATLALNGIGFEKTKVKIISDPAAERNQHTVIAEGSFGRFEIKVEAAPSKNPGTSSLAGMGAFEAVKSIQRGGCMERHF